MTMHLPPHLTYRGSTDLVGDFHSWPHLKLGVYAPEVLKGDLPGHEFRGNQHAAGRAGADRAKASALARKAALHSAAADKARETSTGRVHPEAAELAAHHDVAAQGYRGAAERLRVAATHEDNRDPNTASIIRGHASLSERHADSAAAETRRRGAQEI